MNLQQVLEQRRSVRAFTSQVPTAEQVRVLIEKASRAASGGNMQPWRVVALAGDALKATLAAVDGVKAEEGPTTMSYPESLWEPYRTRRFANGEDLYRSIGVPREDKPARLKQLARNMVFFDAPVGIFICVDERMNHPQWADLGIYLQSLMLLATEAGLATCPQGFWRRHNPTLVKQLELPEPYRIAFGVALGYEDETAPINSLRTPRAPFEEWAELRGF